MKQYSWSEVYRDQSHPNLEEEIRRCAYDLYEERARENVMHYEAVKNLFSESMVQEMLAALGRKDQCMRSGGGDRLCDCGGDEAW
jgi:hypothetical protein